MNPDYTRTAHREAVYAKLVQELRDRYLNGEMPAKDKILCTKVLYEDSEVSQEAIFDVIERLMDLQAREERRRNQYVLRRRDHEQEEADEGPKQPRAQNGEGDPPPTKPGKKPR
jgi:DNA-binding FadR family transcriptional regulator